MIQSSEWWSNPQPRASDGSFSVRSHYVKNIYLITAKSVQYGAVIVVAQVVTIVGSLLGGMNNYLLILLFLRSGTKVKVKFCYSTRNAWKNGKRSVLTLDSPCLPCYIWDRTSNLKKKCIQGGRGSAPFTETAYRLKYFKPIPKEINQDVSTVWT